jgi:hypothetical protein
MPAPCRAMAGCISIFWQGRSLSGAPPDWRREIEGAAKGLKYTPVAWHLRDARRMHYHQAHTPSHET